MEFLIGAVLQFLVEALFVGVFGAAAYPGAKAGRRFWVWVPGLLVLTAFVFWRGHTAWTTWALAACGLAVLGFLDWRIARPAATRTKD